MTEDRTLEDFLNREWPNTYFMLQVTGQELDGKRCITIHRPGNEFHVINLVVDGNTLTPNHEYKKHWWQRKKKR